MSASSEERPARTRRAEARREALEEAALALFERQGYTATTVDEIAAAVGVSHVTFFRYFPAKDDVLFARGQERRQQIVAALAARPASESAFTALRAACLAVVADYQADRARLRLVRGIIERTPGLVTRVWERRLGWEEAIVDVLAARERGVVNPLSSLEQAVLAGAAILALRSASSLWIDDETADLEALVVAAFDQLEEGFGTDRFLRRSTDPAGASDPRRSA